MKIQFNLTMLNNVLSNVEKWEKLPDNDILRKFSGISGVWYTIINNKLLYYIDTDVVTNKDIDIIHKYLPIAIQLYRNKLINELILDF